jgi:uncharacterized membrane protein
MNVALWMVQGILAFAFVTSGRINAFAHEQAYPNMTWVHSLPSALVTFIGVCELAGAVGVIVPWGLRRSTASDPVLLSLSLFVAWGRWSALRANA